MNRIKINKDVVDNSIQLKEPIKDTLRIIITSNDDDYMLEFDSPIDVSVFIEMLRDANKLQPPH